MDTNDIINYLKENIVKGVSYFFMPDPVRDWVDENLDKVLLFNRNKDWEHITNKNYEIEVGDVVGLDKSFVLNENEGWVEFDIDKDGAFKWTLNDINKKDILTQPFYWYEFGKFLNYSHDHNLGFTAFGGWQYDGFSQWFTSPQVKITNCDSYFTNGYFSTDKSEPVIPIKIRFWKGLIKND